jgi:DNA-binding Lrp family transcriptional regulator
MDEIDIILSLELSRNSRITYRKLAEKLGLSTNAVHKRIKTLVGQGVIRKFTTEFSLPALNAMVVLVFGKSDTKYMDKTIKKLGENEFTYYVIVAGGNYIYVQGILRNSFEMAQFISYVKKEGNMPNPVAGIAQMPAPPAIEFSCNELDYKIICALSGNSRRNLSEVAKELDISPSTVRRRFSKMEANRSIVFSIDWNPAASNDVISFFHVTTKDGVDMKRIYATLTKNYYPNILSVAPLSNLPNFMVCNVWAKTMKELKDIQNRLQKEEFVETIVPNIFYNAYTFESWKDEELKERAGIGK